MKSFLKLVLCLAPAMLLPMSAGAQTLTGGFSAQNYDPSYAGDRFFTTPSATVQGHFSPALKLTGNYAYKPLRIIDKASGNTISNGVLLKDQLYLHVDASLALWDRLMIAVGVPVAVYQDGDQPDLKTTSMADMRAGLRLTLFGTEEDAFALGVQGDVWFPTGDPEQFTGDEGLRAHPRLVASGLLGERFAYSAAVGAMVREHHDLGIAEVGSAITYSGALAYLAWDKRFQIGPEIFGSTTPSSKDSPVEAMLGARLCASSFTFGLGAGTAITDAAGAAAFRGVADIAWIPGKTCGKADADGDGIPDADDACPNDAGVPSDHSKYNGCPDRDGDGIPDKFDACPDDAGIATEDPKTNGCPDRDADGIPDIADACPDEAGSANNDPKVNGCPDKDGDGIVDKLDACPNEPGPATGDPRTEGCPDRDGDGIVDKFDACPDEAGPANDNPRYNGCPDRDGDDIPDKFDACPDKPGPFSEDPKKNGCPAVAVLRKGAIVILQQVQFDTGKATIRRQSDALLTEVAEILREHPEITSLAVDGHTDNRGSHATNVRLSQNRANAVRDWLVKRGKVEASRLTARGFGPDKPIDTNDTEEGRQKNRRVEFNIISQTEQPEAE